jgi:hypothetical protein
LNLWKPIIADELEKIGRLFERSFDDWMTPPCYQRVIIEVEDPIGIISADV